MSRLRRRLLLVGDERGAIMIIVGICLVMIMAVAALTIDLGMLQATRAETQRAADASALAGASVYQTPLPTAEGAEARALEWAQKNFIRGKAGDAGELDITVDHAAQRVTVRIQQSHDTWFARILGINSAIVGAIAAARVIQSGTVTCIRPFGLPDDAYSEDDIGNKVLLWESRSPANNDDDEGHNAFLIVGNTASNPGLGYDVYDMLTSDECANEMVQVGDEIPAKPGNNQLGSIKRGLRDLETEFGVLTWDENGVYSGFNKPDWESDPRVALIPLYDGSTYTGPGTDNVTVTGFVRVAIVDGLVACHSNANANQNPCYFEGNGQRQQLYAVMLPAIGISDGCAGEACSDTNLALQLVE